MNLSSVRNLKAELMRAFENGPRRVGIAGLSTHGSEPATARFIASSDRGRVMERKGLTHVRARVSAVASRDVVHGSHRATPDGALGNEAVPKAYHGRSFGQLALGVAKKHGRSDGYVLAIRHFDTSKRTLKLVDYLAGQAKNEVDVAHRSVPRALLATNAGAPFASRCRPLMIGCSVCHVNGTAGTLGAFVRDRAGDDHILILSNNHVLALVNGGKRKDRILQPSPADGGLEVDTIANLERFLRIRKRRRGNLHDAAVAALVSGHDYDPVFLPEQRRFEGLRQGPTPTGLSVHKTGRTTGHTRGHVTATELDGVPVSFEVETGPTFARFDAQIEIKVEPGQEPFSEPGDSGSLILDDENRALGLLFAGDGVEVTYANPIESLLDALNVDLLY